MLCFSFSSYRDPQLFTTTLQGVTSKWRRLTTVYQGLSIRFRRALTLLRGNDRVTAKSWSTTRGRGANYAAREGKFLLSNMALFYFTICLSTASTVLLAFWYGLQLLSKGFHAWKRISKLEKLLLIPYHLLTFSTQLLQNVSECLLWRCFAIDANKQLMLIISLVIW